MATPIIEIKRTTIGPAVEIWTAMLKKAWKAKNNLKKALDYRIIDY